MADFLSGEEFPKKRNVFFKMRSMAPLNFASIRKAKHRPSTWQVQFLWNEFSNDENPKQRTLKTTLLREDSVVLVVKFLTVVWRIVCVSGGSVWVQIKFEMEICVLFRRQGRQSCSSVDCCTCSLFTATEQDWHSIARHGATVGKDCRERTVCVCVCVCVCVLRLCLRTVVCYWVTLGSVSLCIRGRNNAGNVGQEFMVYCPTFKGLLGKEM